MIYLYIYIHVYTYTYYALLNKKLQASSAFRTENRKQMSSDCRFRNFLSATASSAYTKDIHVKPCMATLTACSPLHQHRTTVREHFETTQKHTCTWASTHSSMEQPARKICFDCRATQAILVLTSIGSPFHKHLRHHCRYTFTENTGKLGGWIVGVA